MCVITFVGLCASNANAVCVITLSCCFVAVAESSTGTRRTRRYRTTGTTSMSVPETTGTTSMPRPPTSPGATDVSSRSPPASPPVPPTSPQDANPDSSESLHLGYLIGLVAIGCIILAVCIYKIHRVVMNREIKRKIELMLSRAQEGGDFVEVESVARFTKDEMEAAINALSSGVRQDDRLVYHFTSKKTAGFILEGQGLRASKVGQLGGGLSVCKAPPHEMGWEQYGGPTWREGVGRRLWGEKWENVLMGHEDADKLEVVIVAKIPGLLFNDTSCARSLLFRTCIPFPVELDAAHKKAFPVLQPPSIAYAHQNIACLIPH